MEKNKKLICKKTLSGKHIWQSENVWLKYTDNKTAVMSRCVACGIVNDLRKK